MHFSLSYSFNSSFCRALSIGIALIEAAIAPVFPLIYNTSDSVRDLASFFIFMGALFTPFSALIFASYYTLRSGGNVLVTFLFDSAYSWVVVMPVALILAHLTPIPIHLLYIICMLVDTAKCTIAVHLVRKGSWARRLSEPTKEVQV